MKKVRVLLTGAGAPGFPSILNCLRHNGERELYIVCVDMNPMAVGRSMGDRFYQVPSATDSSFVDKVLEICKKEKIDVLISIVTRELGLFSLAKNSFENIGTKVSVMDYETLHIANNKGLLLSAIKKSGLPTPNFKIAKTPDELEKAIYELGYPNNPVVVKPTFGNGSRGVRILDSKKSRFDRFFYEKPSSQTMFLEELLSIINERTDMPEMIAMEFLPNEEISVDIFADNGDTLYFSCRQGVVVSSIMVSSVIKFNSKAIDLAKAVTKELHLSGCVGFDMKVDVNGQPQIMEINPRLPAGIVNSVVAGVNFPYLQIKYLLKEKMPKCKATEGYMMQFRNSEVLYSPNGEIINWD